MKFLVRTALMVGALWATIAIVPGLAFEGAWGSLVLMALLVALANAVVIPILKVLALPLRILTLGLATLAINIGVLLVLLLAAESMDLGISSDGIASSLLGALVLTVLSSVVSFFVKD
ncbi:phage holin family protein [Actinomycetota bacterium]